MKFRQHAREITILSEEMNQLHKDMTWNIHIDTDCRIDSVTTIPNSGHNCDAHPHEIVQPRRGCICSNCREGTKFRWTKVHWNKPWRSLAWPTEFIGFQLPYARLVQPAMYERTSWIMYVCATEREAEDGRVSGEGWRRSRFYRGHSFASRTISILP